MDIKAIESWYIKNHRKLKFRETVDPYHIWISEIMLQQTQVETVIPYFERFIEIYPQIKDLANTDLEKLRKVVEGLGYYRRFKLMHQAALKIMKSHHGVFPKNYDEVLKLPGIGKYTAGAIMSIAYHKPYSALDGNVIRVLSRYYGIEDDFRLQKNKDKLNQKNQDIIASATPQIYTQALMELGALVCRPKNPKCDICPIQEHCVAYHQNLTDILPVLSKLSKPKVFNYITLVISDNKHVYLRKREESLLEGMYEYPQYEAESMFYVKDLLAEKGVFIDCHEVCHTYKHVFSHQTWHMDVFQCRLIKNPDSSWIPVLKQDITNVPMGIAHRKISLLNDD